MNIAILITGLISIISFLVAAALYFYYIIFKGTIQVKAAERSTLLFTLDLKERRVKSLQSIAGEVKDFLDFKTGKWLPTNDLLSHFDDQEIHRLFREAMHELESGHETTSFMHVTQPNTLFRKESLIRFEFTKMTSTNDYTVAVKWEPIKKTINKDEIVPPPITLEGIANDLSLWKGFFAFNAVSDVKDSTNKFINLVYNIVRNDVDHYIIIAGYVIFFIGAPTEKAIMKKVQRFMAKMESKGLNRGANHLFEGSAYVTSDKVTTIKNIGGIIKTLDYFVNKSIKDKKNFVSFDKDYDRDDFHSFVEASKSFRAAARVGDIQLKKIVVRSWKSKRKAIEYIFPYVEGISQSMLATILKNKNNKELLINANSRNIAINQVTEEPVLVDINASWFLDEKANMQYKKAIYVINLNHIGNKDQLRESLLEMQAKGFVFALRLTQLNENISMIIQHTRPGFIVIDHSFWGERELLSTSLLIQLMTIRKLASSANTKLIYEDPSEFVDEETAAKIGLDFYYSLKNN